MCKVVWVKKEIYRISRKFSKNRILSRLSFCGSGVANIAPGFLRVHNHLSRYTILWQNLSAKSEQKQKSQQVFFMLIFHISLRSWKFKVMHNFECERKVLANEWKYYSKHYCSQTLKVCYVYFQHSSDVDNKAEDMIALFTVWGNQLIWCAIHKHYSFTLIWW